MNSCIARPLPACSPPLMTLKLGTGSTCAGGSSARLWWVLLCWQGPCSRPPDGLHTLFAHS
jgi:hypothetical protein